MTTIYFNIYTREVIMNTINNPSNDSIHNTRTFRYKLSDEIVTFIAEFSKLHQYDDRHAYKDAWGIWLNDNREFVSREEKRLKDIGFNGDVIDKMFKAGRYYFREKKGKPNTKSAGDEGEDMTNSAGSEGKGKGKVKTRNYITMNPDFIKSIDTHLKKSVNDDEFKPQTSFIQFVEENKDILQNEVRRLYGIMYNYNNNTIIDKEIVHKEILAKLKKTFKNLYFTISKLQV